MTDDEPGRLPEVKAIQQTRRLLANARERTRVHTISAAFEALRKQVRLLFSYFLKFCTVISILKKIWELGPDKTWPVTRAGLLV